MKTFLVFISCLLLLTINSSIANNVSFTNISLSGQNILNHYMFIEFRANDLPGKEVTTLINEKLQSGTYEVSFNATYLPNGLYFYRTEANKFSPIKKIIILN